MCIFTHCSFEPTIASLTWWIKLMKAQYLSRILYMSAFRYWIIRVKRKTPQMTVMMALCIALLHTSLRLLAHLWCQGLSMENSFPTRWSIWKHTCHWKYWIKFPAIHSAEDDIHWVYPAESWNIEAPTGTHVLQTPCLAPSALLETLKQTISSAVPTCCTWWRNMSGSLHPTRMK